MNRKIILNIEKLFKDIGEDEFKGDYYIEFYVNDLNLYKGAFRLKEKDEIIITFLKKPNFKK